MSAREALRATRDKKLACLFLTSLRRRSLLDLVGTVQCRLQEARDALAKLPEEVRTGESVSEISTICQAFGNELAALTTGTAQRPALFHAIRDGSAKMLCRMIQ